MRKQLKTRQTGISFLLLMILIALGAGGAVLGAQVFPTVLEYQAAVKAINKASEGSTVPEVRDIFDRAAQIDDIRSIAGRDLVIAKDGDQVVVSFAYNKEIHMFGPAYLLLKYTGQSRPHR